MHREVHRMIASGTPVSGSHAYAGGAECCEAMVYLVQLDQGNASKARCQGIMDSLYLCKRI